MKPVVFRYEIRVFIDIRNILWKKFVIIFLVVTMMQFSYTFMGFTLNTNDFIFIVFDGIDR